MCYIAQDEMPYVMQDVEEAYYCVPTIEDGQWDDLSKLMGLVKSSVGQEGPLMADPCSEEQMMSNNEKIGDKGMSGWLELQEKAKLLHNNQMKELVTSHMEDQQQSVPAEIDTGKWDPQKMGPNKQVSRKVPSHHGSAHSPMKEYGLGVKKQVTTMDMLKRSDLWIADSGASNHVTFSGKGCRNKRIATRLTHGIMCTKIQWIH